MKYTTEMKSIGQFPAWGEARETLNIVRARMDLKKLTTLCEEVFDGRTPTDIEINNWLWSEPESIYKSLGYKIIKIY